MIKNVVAISIFIFSTFYISATSDPYRAIIDMGLYCTDDKVLIVQNIYDFDYAKISNESIADPIEVYIIEKEIVNSSLVTKKIRKFSTYIEAMKELVKYENIMPLRPAIHLEVEKLIQVINIAYLNKHVSSLYNSENIIITNYSSLYSFDANVQGKYQAYYLVQVDYVFVEDGCYRKTVLVDSSDLWENLDTRYF